MTSPAARSWRSGCARAGAGDEAGGPPSVPRSAEVDDKRRFVLFRVVDIYAKLKPDEQPRFEAELERHRNKEVQEMVITWEEALAASKTEGIQLGLEQGVRQGLEQGARQGKAALLKRLLTHCFGVLPEWAERVLEAKRLEDVFDPE